MKSGQVKIERKVFDFCLRENARGRFLRITEETAGKRNTIIIPSTGLEDIQKLLEGLLQYEASLPPAAKSPDNPEGSSAA